ncbi:PRC-barrel domain-containing protein [Methanobrevibacter curvatus]|jgi:sporulation protein YlmC with PRC-barrel domain|uniref:PRC-barrel domain protein n=1 Tax=Methanobrevibacter curvatus TaxID=49547 RepID=A0A166C3S8_9EURY|nr:PRC-barrel domain-containing protein [Methanobrevibacter curvatus]KZX11027.1 PRC-barrel domain protein [Methanobrevibacter curvatus]
MDDKKNVQNPEEKLWSSLHGYDVATSDAHFLGKVVELIINENNGKIVDIVVNRGDGRNIPLKGIKADGNLLQIPFSRIEKVGEFIIVSV